MTLPYLGITGVVTPGDVEIIRECRAIAPPSHLVMAGVLVSGKTLKHIPVTNRRYPKIDMAVRLVESLSLIGGVFPAIHYNTGGDDRSLLVQLRDLLDLFKGFKGFTGGLQLNVVKPDPSSIRIVREMFPDVKIILQVNGSSIGSRRTPEKVAEYLRSYTGLMDYALIDFSGGNGKPSSPSLWYDILHHLGPMSKEHNFGLGVAGGLGPDGGSTILEVHYHGPLEPFSTDVESKVRVPVSNPIYGEKYQDQLDLDLSLAYTRSVGLAL